MSENEPQIKIIGKCLNAVANGPFIPDWEFHVLLGFTREEVNAILLRWPSINGQDNVVVKTVINNSINTIYRLSN